MGTGQEEEDDWREAHAFVYIDEENIILDGVLAETDNEIPCIMVPKNGETLKDLEAGYDIEATQIRTNFKRIYGLGAGGFGKNLRDK